MIARRLPSLALLVLAFGCASEPSSTPDSGPDTGTSAPTGESSESESTGSSMGETESETSAGDGDGDPAEAVPDFFGERPLNIAHRGGRFEFPEHTLVAYAGALSVGADVLELDVHLSADDTLVVIHDFTVDRTTEGSGAIAELNLAEIQAFDAGYSWSPDGGMTHPYRGMGLFIPTAEEVFEAFPDELYVIEIKPEDTAVADALVAALDQAELLDRVIVSSSQAGITEYVRELAPTLHTGLTVAEVIELIGVNPNTAPDYTPPARFVQVPLEYGGLTVITPYLVELADSKGMKVHPWTINEVDEMQMLLDWGVHGIMTDWPTTLTEVIDGR